MNTRDLLTKLGFEEVWGTMTDQEPSYRYDFGNLTLDATQVMNLRFGPVLLCGGVVSNRRTIREIDFEMPLNVESFEQGVAWIVYGIGKDFRPRNQCAWFFQGLEWQDQLPWERRRIAYEARPHCKVGRDWIRLAIKKLRNLATQADETDLAVFEFDGEVLRISACGEIFAMAGKGNAWKEPYAIKVNKLDFLPKRIKGRDVHLSVWEGKFTIGKRNWHLDPTPCPTTKVSEKSQPRT